MKIHMLSIKPEYQSNIRCCVVYLMHVGQCCSSGLSGNNKQMGEFQLILEADPRTVAWVRWNGERRNMSSDQAEEWSKLSELLLCILYVYVICLSFSAEKYRDWWGLWHSHAAEAEVTFAALTLCKRACWDTKTDAAHMLILTTSDTNPSALKDPQLWLCWEVFLSVFLVGLFFCSTI